MNLSLVSGLVHLGFSIVAPILPQYALSFSVSVAVMGWAISSFALARVFVDLPAGILADRFGRKRGMILGLVLIILSSVVAGMAPSFSWLIASRVVQGAGSAIYTISAMTWVAQVSGGERRGMFMSLYTSLVFAGTAFGPIIGGYSAAHFGLNAPFFMYGGFAALGLLATISLREPKDYSLGRLSPMLLADLRPLFLNRSFLLVNSSVFAVFFLRGGVLHTLIPLYAFLNLDLSAENIGILLTVAAVVSTIFRFPSGWLSDKIGRKIPVMASLLMATLAVFLIPMQESTGNFAAVLVLYGFAMGLHGSMAVWPADVAPPGKLGLAMGVYRLVGDIGLTLGPITATYAAGYIGGSILTSAPFIIIAVVPLVASVFLIWAEDPVAKKVKGGI